MAISKIAGQMLKDTLERDGANLAISDTAVATPVIFVDITNSRVGIDNATPTQALDIVGNVIANNLFSSNTISATGNILGGNVNTAGAMSATGNSTANFFIGNGSQLTGIDATSIQNGNSNVKVYANANVATSVGGNANVFVVTGTGANVTGTVSATGNITGNGVTLSANAISAASGQLALGSNANITITGGSLSYVLSTDGAGNLSWASGLGNLTVANTTISTALANGNITLTSTGTGLVTVSGSSGIIIPHGNTTQRPSPAAEGTLRYNNALNQTEIYTGSDWESIGGAIANITNQTITPDGSTVTYTLDQDATATGILVTINGINQTPNVDYTVATNQITFTDTPQTTDIIQIRFIATVSTVGALTNSAGTAEVNITAGGNINFDINNVTVAQVTSTSILNISDGHSLQLPAYTVAQANGLGNVTTGQVIYVSNGASGSPCLAVYSGGAWTQVAIGSTITT